MIKSLKTRQRNYDKNNVRPLQGYTVNSVNIIIPHEFNAVFLVIITPLGSLSFFFINRYRSIQIT